MYQIAKLIKEGKIGVMPTDTIYGIVGSALNSTGVERIYKLRKRSTNKPFIILISSLKDLSFFDIKLTKKQKDFLQKNWPNPLSIVLPCPSSEFKYLHRDNNSLAFRMPKDKRLLNLLKETGPLVAPSANFEGEKVAENLEEAKNYFKDKVDFYIDGGNLNTNASDLIKLNKDGSFTILRKGNIIPAPPVILHL